MAGAVFTRSQRSLDERFFEACVQDAGEVHRGPGGWILTLHGVEVVIMPLPDVNGLLKTAREAVDRKQNAEAIWTRLLHTQTVYSLIYRDIPVDRLREVMTVVGRINHGLDGVLLWEGDFYTRSGSTFGSTAFPTPTPEQVVRQTLLLGALSARSYLEFPATGSDLALKEQRRQAMIPWLDERVELDACTKNERALLTAPIGEGDMSLARRFAFVSHGAEVLLWALSATDRPAPDRWGSPGDVLKQCGYAGEDPSWLAEPTLRDADEIAAFRRVLLAVQWLSVRPRQPRVDVASRAMNIPTGAFSLDGVELVNGDLAFRGVAMAEANAKLYGLFQFSARERTIAANWLIGVNPVYSHVFAPTIGHPLTGL